MEISPTSQAVYKKVQIQEVLFIVKFNYNKNDNVTYKPTARQRLGKHISAGANARNRTPIARQQISKHASLTTEAMFSSWL
jgi:hypothetical protein